MADSSSLPAPDISHEQPSISTHPTPDEKEATPTPAINDDDTVPNSPSGASEWPAYIRGRKRKWSALGIEQKHMDDLEGIALGYHMAMMQDQLDVLHPPTPTAFASTEDALRRLLPYHIYQVHDSELDGQEALPAHTQAQRQKEEIELSRRINAVHERTFMLKRREGTHPSALPSLISLIQSSTETIRQETAAVQAKYKEVKGVWDAVEAEQKERERAKAAAIAQANALRAPPPPAPKPAPTPAPAPASAPVSLAAPPRSAAPAASSYPVTAPRPAPTLTPTPPVVSAPTTDTSELLPKVSRGRGRPPGAKTTPRPPGTTGTPQASYPATSSGQIRPPSASAVNSQPPRIPVPPNAAGVHPAPVRPGQPGQPSGPIVRPTMASGNAVRPHPPAGPSGPAGPSARPPYGTPATPASAGPTGESSYKKDALPTTPSTLRMTVKQLPQLVNLGIVTLPRDPKVKTPGYVSQISANKEVVTVVVTLAECSHIQLTTLAKMLGVAGKPAEGGAKPAEGVPKTANGTASATSTATPANTAAAKKD